MNSRVVARMSTQWGLVTRAQALETGMAPDQVDRLIRARRWVVVRRGVYAEASYVAGLTSTAQRRLLADRAGSLRIGSPHVLSHHSAAYLLGLGVLTEPDPITHVTRPGIVGSHHRHGVKHHRAPYDAGQLTVVDGIAVLGAARTALDITRELGYRQGLVAADSAMREGASRGELEAIAAGMTNWPYATVVRDVIASATGEADNPAESLGRELVTELGYGVPQAQFGLTADGRTVWCDLRLGRHFFEIDGRVKYRSVAEGGLSTAPEETLWEEKGRQDFVTGFKVGVSRLVWVDFFGIGRSRALERIRREYLDTCARFGTDIGDLASYRPRGPRPRPRPRGRGSLSLPPWAA